MRSIGPQIWIDEQPAKIPVVGNLGVRMTVIRLKSGKVMVISPIPMTENRKSELAQIGPVEFLIGPNSMHHLSLRKYQETYPLAQLVAPEKLQKKRANLKFQITLKDNQSYPWSDEVEMLIVDGKGTMSEAVFYHKLSHTLIVTDLLFNISKPEKWSERIVYFINGLNRGLTTSNLARTVFNDRKYLKQQILKISQWEFDQIVLAHGEIVTENGKQRFLDSFQWL